MKLSNQPQHLDLQQLIEDNSPESIIDVDAVFRECQNGDDRYMIHVYTLKIKSSRHPPHFNGSLRDLLFSISLYFIKIFLSSLVPVPMSSRWC